MSAPRPSILVRKLSPAGEEVFAYPGVVLSRTATALVLEAPFLRDDRLDLGYAVFEHGDRFVEYFYADRWYNLFEVHAADGRLKGWYCNVTRPAVIEDGRVSAVDLALDVWVAPDGSALVLDEDEFAQLPLGAEEIARAREAIEEIERLAREGAPPFQR